MRTTNQDFGHYPLWKNVHVCRQYSHEDILYKGFASQSWLSPVISPWNFIIPQYSTFGVWMTMYDHVCWCFSPHSWWSPISHVHIAIICSLLAPAPVTSTCGTCFNTSASAGVGAHPGHWKRHRQSIESVRTYGVVHRYGYPFIAGWSMSGKSLLKLGWQLRVAPFQETPVWN